MIELGIAKTLIQKRKEKGITQDDLASYIGVTKASVSKWETGQSYPDITFLPQLASYFNISIDELINYQPQMIREDIQKLYLRLSKDFGEKPFDDVMCEIKALVKKYFSCFPLLYHMGALLTNHYMLAEEGIQKSILLTAIGLFERIKSECSDFMLCKQSLYLEAVCYLFLAEPVKSIELLEEANTPVTNESNLLSIGYSMNGNPEKAKEILQIGIYQNLLCILQNLTSLLPLESTEPQSAAEIIKRITAISDVFDVDHLHPATMLSVYLNLAAAYVAQEDTSHALSALQKYSDLALGMTYPLRLHGDEFFNSLNEWLTQLDLGINAPRSEKTVKHGIFEGAAKNPAFSALSDNIRYQNIIRKLSALLEEQY